MFKNMFILMVMTIVSYVVIVPSSTFAQQIERQSNVELVNGEFTVMQESGLMSDFLDIGLLFVVVIGIPGVVSYAIRSHFKDNLKSYVGTYIFVVFCYIMARLTLNEIPGGDDNMVVIYLVLPSMIGSMIAQTVYMLKLPKTKYK
ncbi:MAG: hypothetical protein QM500_07395 [Methylococcales bacterium]